MTASDQMFDDVPATPPMDIRALVGALAKRWKLIVAVPVLVLLAVFLVMQAVPSVYQSSIQVLVFDPQQAAAISSGQETTTAQDFDTVAINTEVEILKSASLSLQVAKELRLDELPEFQLRGKIDRLLDLLHLPSGGWVATHLRALGKAIHGDTEDGSDDPAAQAAWRLAVAAGILRDSITVDHVAQSYVIIVSVKAQDPRLAQRLVTAIVDTYFKGQRDAWRKALDEQMSRLSSRLAGLAAQVAETDAEIDKIKAKSGVGGTSAGSVSEGQIAQLNAQLMLARSAVGERRVRLEQARHLAATNGDLLDIPEASASPVISQLRLQRTQLAQQEAQLRAKLGDRHAQVLAVAAQLADVDKALSDQEMHILADMQNAYDIAVRQEQSIEANLQQLTASLDSSGDYVKLQELQRTAAQTSKLYDAYVPQYDAVKTRESLGDIGQRVISAAAVPSSPISPKRVVIFAGAGFFGTALGVMVAFIAETLQGQMRIGGDAEHVFGYSVLGNIPFVRARRASRSGTGKRNLAQVVVGAPLSPFSEAVRAIRIGIRLSQPGSRPKIVLVTSSLPGEGKSTVATLLAASSASAGQRTVLVDTDVRGRSVSRAFGNQQRGLTDLLSGTAGLQDVVIEDSTTGCHIIPVGSLGQSPADLLGSQQMRDLVQRLRNDYDYVVIDTAPILSVIDPLVIASMAEKILMIVDVGYRHNDSLVEAFRLLRSNSDLAVGIVFNKVTTDQLRQSGYSNAGNSQGRDWLVEEPVIELSAHGRNRADFATLPDRTA
jgi:succinoglycan biosynthesis transport protein ExoP